ncbi:MAG: Ni,Fe-hydrogenase maturation factor [Thermoproteus sp.]
MPPGKILIASVGYFLKRDCSIGYEAGRILKAKGYEVLELSGDVFAMVDELRSRPHEVLILLGTIQKGRPPGTIEVYEFVPQKFEDYLEAADALRPSLEGRISLQDLLTGLSVLGPVAEKVYVVDCEPPVPEPGIGLSPEGEKCAERMAEKVVELLGHV